MVKKKFHFLLANICKSRMSKSDPEPANALYVFFTSLLKRCDKRCLVVTELRQNRSIFPMYTVSVQYTKVAEVLEIMHYN